MRILKKEINKVNKEKGKKRMCFKISVQLLVGFLCSTLKKISLQFSTSQARKSLIFILFYNSIIPQLFSIADQGLFDYDHHIARYVYYFSLIFLLILLIEKYQISFLCGISPGLLIRLEITGVRIRLRETRIQSL